MLIYFYGFIGKCYEPLKNPNFYSDNIRYDMVLSTASSQLGRFRTSSKLSLNTKIRRSFQHMML